MKTMLVRQTFVLVTFLVLSAGDALAQLKVYELEARDFYFTIIDNNGEGPVTDPDGNPVKNPDIDVVRGDRVKIILTSRDGKHNWDTDVFGHTKDVNVGETDSHEFEANQTNSFEYYCSRSDHRIKGMAGKLIIHRNKRVLAAAVTAVAARRSYDAELDKLRGLSAGSIDRCLNATYVAAINGNVRSILLRNLSNPNYVFKKVSCLETPSIPEYEHVLFDFDCRPGIFCLIDPNVLVIVDVVNGRVVDIVDPFLGGPLRGSTQRVRKLRDADHEIALEGTNNKRFRRGTKVNPTIRVKLGDTVEVTLMSSGGTHDWTLVYVENGREVKWADTSNTNGPAVSTGVFTADRVGEFDYFCDVSSHRADGMRGKFVVER